MSDEEEIIEESREIQQEVVKEDKKVENIPVEVKVIKEKEEVKEDNLEYENLDITDEEVENATLS